MASLFEAERADSNRLLRAYRRALASCAPFRRNLGTREKWVLPQFPCGSRGALWRDGDRSSDIG
jgi:hypothetical protein